VEHVRARITKDDLEERTMKKALSLLALILVKPGKAFAELKESSGWMWLVPAVILMLTLNFYAVVSAPAKAELAKQQIQRQFEKLSQQEVELTGAPPIVTEGPSPTFIAATEVMGGTFILFLGWLVRAFLLHLGTMALGGRGSFKQMFVAVGWAYIPYGIQAVLQGIYVALTGNAIAHKRLSALVATGDPLKDAYNLAYLLLSHVDIFVIWTVILLAIGVAVVGGFSRKKGALLALGYKVLTVVVLIVPSLIIRAFLPQELTM